MNILELPEETLLEILSYVTYVEDIIRCDQTCKRFASLTFKVARDLYIGEEESFGPIKQLLSRDLRFLRKLFILAPELEENEADWLIDRLTILSTLRNLKELTLKFEYDGTDRQWFKKFSDLRQTIQKMVWLETFAYQYPIIEDMGDIFESHSRLTKLAITFITMEGIIEVPYRAFGFNKLTQVKNLALPVDVTDAIFSEVLQLTNLTVLDMSYANISATVAGQLTQLSNLEKIFVCGLDREVVNWKLLRSLPKLTGIRDDIKRAETDDYDELNRMTQLTYLDLSCDAGVTPERLSNLTSIQVLTCNLGENATQANFGHFNKLTRLHFYANAKETDIISLPYGVKNLDLQTKISDAMFDEIVKIDSLESLSLVCSPDDNRSQISRLTNLKFLEFMDSAPRGIVDSLKALPWLRKLRLDYKVDTKTLKELKVLTQLVQLEISVYMYPSTLRQQQFPFAVYTLS